MKSLRKKIRRRHILVTFLGLTLVILALILCLDKTRNQKQAVALLQETVQKFKEGFPSLSQAADGDTLEASGIIQAEQVSIASEFGGYITDIPMTEGDSITAGDLLVQMDTTMLDAQIEVARATVDLASARLAQTQAGVPPGQIAIAEAQLAQAKAARAAATQAVSDTLALVENPQDIRLQIAVAQAQAEAAQHDVAQAMALKDAAEIAKNQFENAPTTVRIPDGKGGYIKFNINIPLDAHLTPNNWWQAWIGVNTTVAQQKGIQASLAHLYAQRAHPQSLETQADEALAALAQTEAQVAIVQAHLEDLKAGAIEEQIAALEARVAQTHAALDSLLTQKTMLKIVSPIDGTVIDIMVHPGEVAAPGTALLTVADLSQVRLTVYLPETQIGQVCLGQRVQVTVDSFPDRIFEGQVTHIADRAEFTPRNVATKEERVNLVFAVKVRMPNDDGDLKPGMPADAVFEE